MIFGKLIIQSGDDLGPVEIEIIMATGLIISAACGLEQQQEFLLDKLGYTGDEHFLLAYLKPV